MDVILFKLLAYGMGTTFFVLILFYFVIRILVKSFPEK
ncbi:OadG-related small transporter subunit [Tissierella carlieri]|uniref:OadG-related small transporter subunit n=1 Tax=Tissierella carlieri TaxID=689904 RepID=A0ABT1SFZ4_9FIRM|nr:OadG-related small transporter subunit [Tissierella carlieri]MCQ4925319.1 OadG-related small transporter subunit [Tissierella carlieri]